ncbi:MAG: CinA family protein [Pseudomonadota bacterium]
MNDRRVESLDDLAPLASDVLDELKARGTMIATAESCTGGLICAALTEIAGSSAAVDRGFITYSNEAKTELVGVPADLIARVGAVSKEVAIAMAEGALERSNAGISVSVTGIAGPGGGSEHKPVGTVHIAVAATGRAPRHVHCWFADHGRQFIRLESVKTALASVLNALKEAKSH